MIQVTQTIPRAGAMMIDEIEESCERSEITLI